MSLSVISKKVEVRGGQNVVVEDGVYNVAFHDLNIHVVAKSAFTGEVRFYIGDKVEKQVVFINEKKGVVFAPTNPDGAEIFPANVERSYFYKVTGGEFVGKSLKAKVEIVNNGTNTVVFEVSFARKLV